MFPRSFAPPQEFWYSLTWKPQLIAYQPLETAMDSELAVPSPMPTR